MSDLSDAVKNAEAALAAAKAANAGPVAQAQAALKAAKTAKLKADLAAAETWLKANWFYVAGAIACAVVGHIL